MVNLFFVLILTFIIALFLVYLISAHDRKRKKLKEHTRAANDDPKSPNIDFRQFSKIVMDICENLKLEIEDVSQLDNDEIIVHAVTQDTITNVKFLIVGFHLHKDETLDNNKVMELSDQIISERISKGIVMTTGQVNPAIKNLPELAPMEFIDRIKLQELIDKYKINY